MGEINCSKKLKTSEVNVVDATFTNLVVPNGKTLNYVLEYFNSQINGLISGSNPIAVKDEGSSLTSNLSSLNFTGAGVTASVIGNDVTVNIDASGTTPGVYVPYTGATANVNIGINSIIADNGIYNTEMSSSYFGVQNTASTIFGLLEYNKLTITDNTLPSSMEVNATGLRFPNGSIQTTAATGTVTSVSALTLGTTGTDVNSSVATGTTTPVITLNIPTASATNRGALSSADWNMFSGKVGGSGTTNYVPKFTASGTLGNSNIYSSGTNTGIGVTTPISPLHISSVNKTISNTLYTSDYITLSAEETAPGFNIISSGSSVGNRGVFKATRSRGTLDTPTAVISGDNTFSLVGAGHDGTTNLTTAGITFLVDGAVSTNVLPQAITFATGAGSSRTERMRINSTGQVGINFVPSSASAAFTVKSTATPSAGENIASFQVSDSSSTFVIQNYSNTDGVFIPALVGNQITGSNQQALNLTGYIAASDDTGSNPIMTFRSATTAFAPATTRPLFDFRNWGTSVMTIAASGNVGIGTITPGTKLEVNGNIKISTIANATTDTDRFLVSDSGVIKYRTGAEMLSDIGAQGSITLTTTGTSGVATLVGNTLNIPQYGGGTVTSVGLSMPSAFTVSNSPITSSGTIAVTGSGTTAQYVRGDGTLANFPLSTGGGSSLTFYLNGSVSQGTFGGVAFREMDRTPILGAGTDFTINADGYIQSFITDAGVPGLLEIPAGNWNFETYFSASSGGGTPSFYIELYKWNGTTLSLIASNSATPEGITNGTAIDLYVTALAVPQTTLLVTDRLAVRIYVTHSGRTITLHTEDSHLCKVITTFSTGLTALNGLTAQVQNLAVGTTGTDFAISSVGTTHTFNLPTASATNRGALSSANWTTFNSKIGGSGTTDYISKFTASGTIGNSLIQDNGTTVAIGTAPSANYMLSVTGSASVLHGIFGRSVKVNGFGGDFLGTNGVRGTANGNGALATSIGGEFYAYDNATNVGVYGLAGIMSYGAVTNIGGRFVAVDATNNYALQLIDGTEGLGKFLKCVDGSNGYANWATMSVADTGLAVTTTGSGEATLVGNTLNIPSSFIPSFKADETYRGININNNSTTVISDGGVVMSSSASTSAQSVASTNFATKQVRLRYFASVVSGGRYTGTRGSALLWFLHGGFRFVCDFNISDTAFSAGCQQFYGMSGVTTDLNYGSASNILVSTLLNIIGVGSEVGDANLQIFHNDGSGTATKVDLGVNFPANRTAGAISTTVYSIQLYNAPMSTDVNYEVINKETGAIATGTVSTNLPLTSQGLNFFATRCMSITSVTNTGQFDLIKLGVYSI